MTALTASTAPAASTLGALKELYAGGLPPVVSVKQELRRNVLAAMKNGDALYPGILGYEQTVLPQVTNAILAGHDILLLGLRGQAKTRLARTLIRFLDEWTPVLVGSPLNEHPFHVFSPQGQAILLEQGDDAAIRWLHREERFQEKLATPDVSVADLIGDIDPIRAANEGIALDDLRAVSFGLIARSNRGVFCINELPDLPPRIQVALFNILEEHDVQVRGIPLRLPLDTVFGHDC